MHGSASVAQSVVHLTRNEKVACSSQVTSSKNQPFPFGIGWFFLFSRIKLELFLYFRFLVILTISEMMAI